MKAPGKEEILFVGAQLRAAEARSAEAHDTFDTDLALVLEAWLVATLQGRKGSGWRKLANAARDYFLEHERLARAKDDGKVWPPPRAPRVSSRRMLRPREQYQALRAFAAQCLSMNWRTSLDSPRGLAERIDHAVGAVLPGQGGPERTTERDARLTRLAESFRQKWPDDEDDLIKRGLDARSLHPLTFNRMQSAERKAVSRAHAKKQAARRDRKTA